MAAVRAEEFYKTQIKDEREYVYVFPAYAAGVGEIVDGVFHTRSDFEAIASPAHALPLPAPRRDPARYVRDITPVSKGDVITVRREGLLREEFAAHDGFVVTESIMIRKFMDNFEFMSQFNWAGKKYRTEAAPWPVMLNDRAPLKGIVLQRDTMLMVNGLTRNAKAGSLLCENGRRLIESPNAFLRLSPAWVKRLAIAERAHQTALKRQKELREKSRRHKGKKP